MTTAFNVVRFRVKPGHEQAFIDAHRNADFAAQGFRRGSLVKARPTMIGVLDSFRADLEDLGGGLGVTDPVSGELVLSLP